MLAQRGVHGIKAAHQLDLFSRRGMHPEPAFQGAGRLQTGHAEAYKAGGTINLADFENGGLHAGRLRSCEAEFPALCYP